MPLFECSSATAVDLGTGTERVSDSLQHPSAGEGPNDASHLNDFALGGLIFILIALLLATIANLLIGIAAHGMGAHSEKGDGTTSAPTPATDR